MPAGDSNLSLLLAALVQLVARHFVAEVVQRLLVHADAVQALDERQPEALVVVPRIVSEAGRQAESGRKK